MKKLNCLVLAFAALAATAASAQTNVINNWKSANGENWVSAQGLCWRDANWTPATADTKCDGALKPIQAPAAPTKEVPAPVAPAPIPVPVAVTSKVTIQADTLFDFDKSALKPAGKQALDSLAEKIKNVDLEVAVATGYTDWTGSVAYNQKLSLRRADAVKAYLVEQGVPAEKVFVAGKGKTNFIASNLTKAGRAENRRVEIEVVGTSTALQTNTTKPATEEGQD